MWASSRALTALEIQMALAPHVDERGDRWITEKVAAVRNAPRLVAQALAPAQCDPGGGPCALVGGLSMR